MRGGPATKRADVRKQHGKEMSAVRNGRNESLQRSGSLLGADVVYRQIPVNPGTRGTITLRPRRVVDKFACIEWSFWRSLASLLVGRQVGMLYVREFGV